MKTSKAMIKLTANVTALFLVASAFVIAPSQQAQAATNVNSSTAVNDLFNTLNNYRKSTGAKPVKYNSKIESVAKGWAIKLADKDSYSISPNPNYAFDSRIDENWTNVSEVVAYSSSSSGKSIGSTIINSPGNKQIVKDKTYTHIGIGTAKGKSGMTYATVDFFRYDKDPAGTMTAPKKTSSSSSSSKIVVKGAINSRYKSLGSHKSYLGKPKSNEKKLKSGAYQSFSKGSIYWSKKTGAWAVKKNTGISKKWAKQKYERGSLGYPTSNEKPLKNSKGTVYQNFKGGEIVYSKKTGAYIVKGSIKSKWNKLGSGKSKLKLPKSDEKKLKKGSYQKFEKGKIYYSKKTGSQPIYYGTIHSKWAKTKYEKGKLGYPTSDQYYSKGKYRQKFQGGYITHAKKKSAKVYYYKKKR